MPKTQNISSWNSISTHHFPRNVKTFAFFRWIKEKRTIWGGKIYCVNETVYNIYAAQTPLSLIVEIEQVKQKGLGGVDIDKALQISVLWYQDLENINTTEIFLLLHNLDLF